MQGAIGAGDAILEKLVEYLLSPLYQIVTVIAILYFLYGVVVSLLHMNNPEKRGAARAHLLYGIIGVFIILSVGAIFKFLNGVVGGGLVY